jgi:hypothetical protein
MRFASRALLAAAAAASCILPMAASSQAPEGACILAGRLADDGHWAPRFEGVELMAADGRRVVGGKPAIAGARQARLAQLALLSRCDGSNPLAQADGQPPFAKGQVPALSAGVVEVDGVAFPKLRTGGELVELRVRYASDRVVMVTR